MQTQHGADIDGSSGSVGSSGSATGSTLGEAVGGSAEDPSPEQEQQIRSRHIQRARATTGSYSITVRIHSGTDPAVVGQLATAVSDAGGITTALDIVESRHDRLVIDLTCSASNGDHAAEVVEAVRAVQGVTVHKVSDRVFLIHLGGKIGVEPTVPLRNRDDLSMAYTPGVGRVSMAIAENPQDVSRLTVKGNSVAVVTDGSAVLGLGNIGPRAAMPVMEGKAALFKRFANIDAWPICLDTQDVDEIVRTVQLIAPGFGGINLEDIAAPRCFEVEARLRELLDIPVFHDDQHGTAIVVLAALRNALRCVDKTISQARIAVSGAGAAGSAIVQLLLAAGAHDVVVWDKEGVLNAANTALPPAKLALAGRTNPRGVTGTLRDAVRDADVFIGVSAPDVLQPEWIDEMAPRPIVFALANPDPEVDIAEATKRAAVVASGRSDYPNQINNVLAFPGVFRGLLDARASQVTTEMLIRAADALASVVSPEELNANYIVPSVFDPDIVKIVAAAISGRA
ncbi:MAG: NAD-dependent malic enzyme [Actinomycetota bacterium]|nr:NAD-dependent malic enzyme [Actinomycetota bacterium]